MKNLIYEIDNFKKKFIDFDFDEILLESNNEYINSNEHYLNFKNKYMLDTNSNYIKLKDILSKFNILNNFYTKSNDNKYTYHYFDNVLKEDYNIKIKKIYIKQKELYSNFYNHLIFLNQITNPNSRTISNYSNINKSRMIKVFNLDF